MQLTADELRDLDKVLWQTEKNAKPWKYMRRSGIATGVFVAGVGTRSFAQVGETYRGAAPKDLIAPADRLTRIDIHAPQAPNNNDGE